jgi:hypothetical protein
MVARNNKKLLVPKRLTWTSFHHPSTQSWPPWPSAAIPGEGQNPDPYFDVFCNVPGVENVRIARNVEDVEQATYIVRKFYCLFSKVQPYTRVGEMENSSSHSPTLCTCFPVLPNNCLKT